jgi:hypothetical protein
MKTSALTAVIGIGLQTLATGACTRRDKPRPPAVAPAPDAAIAAASAAVTRPMDAATRPAATAELEALLFADEPLEQVLARIDPAGAGPKEGPWPAFARALASSRQGKTAAAKKELKGILQTPQAETRVSLLAWHALRALGERPPAARAAEAQGVVIQLHNEGGLGTLAAYADGRVRWLSADGRAIARERPGADAPIDRAVADLLKAAQPLIEGTPSVEQHLAREVKQNYFRITVLTFGGLHVKEGFGPHLDGRHFAAPVLNASMKLLDLLWKEPA